MHTMQMVAVAPGEANAGAISLSPRQTECLFWVQQGKSSRDIGTIMGVSHRIVERHVFRACGRLGVRTRLQAVIRARSLGLISNPPWDTDLPEDRATQMRIREPKSWAQADPSWVAGATDDTAADVAHYQLTDLQWIAIAHLGLSGDGDIGPGGKDNRQFVNAVLWVLRSGGYWRSLPAVYGPWQNARTRYLRWDRARVWKRVFAELIQVPGNDHQMVDTILARVHGRHARATIERTVGPKAARLRANRAADILSGKT